MRLLLRYRTGDPEHPDGDVPPERIRSILSSLGWVPVDSANSKAKLDEVVERMPDTIRKQVQDGQPILIMPRPGLWGIVSGEVHNQLFIRIISEDMSTLHEVAGVIVERFPPAFQRDVGRDLGFDPEVAVRRFDSETRMTVGSVEEAHNAGFWRFARTERRREFVLATSLAAATLFLAGASIAIFLFTGNAGWDYARGYLDRIASAFVTATLTTVINLYFEFRRWRNDKRRVKWAEIGNLG